SDTPFAAHADAVDGTQDQKHSVAGSESAQQFDYGKENHICHEGLAASVAVGEESEYDGADRSHGQSRGHGPNNGALGDVEVKRQRVHQEDDDEEIEGVEGPSQKAGGDRMPLVGAGLWRRS